MHQVSGQAGQTTNKSWYVRCWEKICACFGRFFCCVCSPTTSVSGAGQSQQSTLPLGQRGTIPSSTPQTPTAGPATPPQARSGKAQLFRVEDSHMFYADKEIVNHQRIVIDEVQKKEGGVGTFGYEMSQRYPNDKIGIMVAANAGLPGGDIGNVIAGRKRGTVAYYMNHGGQEERVVANWAETTHPNNDSRQRRLLEDNIVGAWGLKDDGGTDTVQDVDYVTSENPLDYGSVWVVDNARLSAVYNKRRSDAVDPQRTFSACLLFGAGPNASDSGTASGTMRRTRSRRAADDKDYDFFKACIQAVLRTKFDAAIEKNVKVVLFDLTSTDIYAGEFKRRILRDYVALVQEILDEPVGPNGEPRWRYVKHAAIAGIKLRRD